MERRFTTILLGPLLALACAVFPLQAADKSGVTPNTISVPKGPGSIEGLGESFQPSLNSGTANYGISLQLPPGTAGQTPALRLSYEGGGGNGPLGFGWDLGIPGIQRRSDKGIPLYPDDPPPTLGDDWTNRYTTFLDTGKEELVPQANGDYFGRVEGAFIRYRRQGDSWEGTQPDGSRLEFGLTEAGRIQDGTNRVFSWLLERETDTHGNTVTYLYTSFPDAQNQNQKYLHEIRYGPGAPPWDNFHFVVFVYEDRSDWFEDCRSGFPVRTGKRLRSIIIGTQGPDLPGHLAGDFNDDGTPDRLNRRYELEYLNYAGTNSHWSLLAKVTLVGADGVTSLPPATHGYTVSNPPDLLSATDQRIGGTNEPPVVMDSPYIDFADLNGDGLPDILRTYPGGGAHRAYLNQGESEADGARVIGWSAGQSVDGDSLAWNFNLASATDIAHLSDMDGDGLADLVYRSAFGEVYYFASQPPRRWANRQKMSVGDTVPPSPFGLPGVRSADLDFDKRMDIIQSIDTGAGTDYRIWLNLGNSTFARSVTVPQSAGLNLATPGVQIADFNGDRVPDIVWVRPTHLEIAAGLGYGRFSDRVLVPIPDHPATSKPIEQAALEDVTGDGLPDLVLERAAPGQLWYWVNLGNYTLSPLKIITGLPTGIGANAVVRWADLNGNGTTDLVYADSMSEPRLQAVDLGRLMNVEAGPNILTTISNGIGGVTLIGYLPSTRYSLDDAIAGAPWPDSMPFPVQVVSATTNLDSLGHEYVTRFRYHDGYYDPIEKQFRGFARAEQIDVGDPEAPTLVTRSHFDTGKTWRAMKGKLLRLTTEREDGKVFTDEITEWTDPPVLLLVGTDGDTVTYAHPTGSVKRIIELGRGEERRLESEFAYDRYGNEVTNANYGIVVDGDRTAFDDERVTTTQYAINTNAWILRLPARQEVMDENGVVISRSESFYDDETFSGSNLGQVSIGNLTLTRGWIDVDNLTNFVASTRAQYDAYGNPRLTLDPLALAPGGVPDLSRGHARTVDYEAQFHAHPITETIHLGDGKEPLSFGAEYDLGFGRLTRSTDFNGNHGDYGYDALARPVTVLRPGDSPDYPSVEYDYALAVPVTPAGLVNYVETRQLDRAPGTAGGDKRAHYLISRQFVDGLKRPLMTRTEAEAETEGGSSRVVVNGAVRFNARQQTARALNPFFTTLVSTDLDDLLAYESIEAAGWTGLFETGGAWVALSLDDAHQTATRYDAALRPVETENPDRTLGRIVYEPLVIRTFDENDTDPASPHSNTPLVHRQDGLGRLIQADETTRLNDDGTSAGTLNTWTSSYQYDLNDQLIRITDSQNNVRWMAYDGLKRKTFMNDPDSGARSYQYDATGNLVETRDAKDQRVTFTYDGANRILTEDYHDEGLPFSANRHYDPTQPIGGQNQPDVAYFYDTATEPVDLGNGRIEWPTNTKGALIKVVDLAGEFYVSFDARGRGKWQVRGIADPLNGQPVAYCTAMTYDVLDRVVQVTYPDGDRVRQDYNARNLLTRITGGAAANAGRNPFVVSGSRYVPSGGLAKLELGNGLTTTCAYDARQRLQRLVVAAEAAPAHPILAYQYQYDPVANLLRIDDLRQPDADPDRPFLRNTQAFTYDDRERLTSVRYPDPQGDRQIDYRYDRIGNLLSQTSNIDQVEDGLSVVNLGEMTYGDAAGRSNRVGRTTTNAGPHALTSTASGHTLRYDANGNVSQMEGLVGTWDFLNRLVAVEKGGLRAEYVYDFQNRRTLRRLHRPEGSNGPTNSFDLFVNRYFEIRDRDQPVKYVWHGDRRVARVTGTLDPDAARVQRLRLWEGWNLVSIAVTAPDGARQLGLGSDSKIRAVCRWDAGTRAYTELTSTSGCTAGDVLWINAAAAATPEVEGVYADPPDALVPPGAAYVGLGGLESPQVPHALVSAGLDYWLFESQSHQWVSDRSGALMKLDVPQFLGVGIPIFLCPTELTEIPTRLPHHRIHYYLQDHLNSANLLTDAAGNVLEETIFYPFGHTRASWSQAALHGLLPSQYLFSQNERDRESGLDCFGARYLVAFLGRFGSVDPAIETMPQEGLLNPQLLHGYGYAHNNPLKYIDPKGEFAFWAVGAGIGAGVGAVVHTARFIFSKKYRQECQTWRGQEMTGGKVWKGTKGFLKGLAKSVVYGAIGGAIAGSFIDTAGGTALAGAALVGYSTLGGAVGGGGAALLSEGGEVISELARKAIPGKEAVKRLGKAVAVGAALGTVFGAIGGGIGAGVNLSQAGSVVADVGVAVAEETGAALSETVASGPSTAAPQAQPPPSVSRRPSTAAPQTQPPSVSRGPEEEEMIQL